MKFIHNNISFIITPSTSIQDLIEDPFLQNMNMKDWISLLKLWQKSVDFTCLYNILEKKITSYDKSENVNLFSYKDKTYWWDKDTRMGLMNLANCSENLDILFGEEVINISSLELKELLSKLEIYASKCFINTSLHLKNIKSLKTEEDFINYDYTSGYPEKIELK